MSKIKVVTLFPGIRSEEITAVGNKDAVILVGYGSMGIPNYLKADIKKLARRVPVVLTSPVNKQKLKAGIYEVSRSAQRAGVIFGTGSLSFDHKKLAFALRRLEEGERTPENVRRMFS